MAAATAMLVGCQGDPQVTALQVKAVPDYWPDTVTVRNPSRLPQTLKALRVRLGIPGELKPNVVLLPNGETLLVDYGGQQNADGTYQENLYLYRSSDYGRTWSARETLPTPGREGYFTLLHSGVLLLTAQIISADYRNKEGYPHDVVYRSEDGGVTWDKGTPVLHADVGGLYGTDAARNIFELRDGSLLWEVGADYAGQRAWRSYDGGLTWDKSGAPQADPVGFDSTYSQGQWSDEMVLEQKANGDLLGFVRCFPGALPPIPNDPLPADSATNDADNRLVVFRSHDLGSTWTLYEAPFHFLYGEMYPSLLGLDSHLVLLTYTARALQPTVGVQAVIGTNVGSLDFSHDVILISSEVNIAVEYPTLDVIDPAGGGYGNTVQEPDGALLTPYSYLDLTIGKTMVEVVRWQLPPS
jgi:BNR repeat-like domain